MSDRNIDKKPFIGRWVKTNDKPQWIGAVEIQDDGLLKILIEGGGVTPSPKYWGEAWSESIYGNAIDSTDSTAGAFAIGYSFDDEMDILVQANLNLGLLVVATFITFRDPVINGRFGPRFTREFFRREDTPA
jgi:hypothetical protein